VQDEVNQDSEQNEVDVMKKGADNSYNIVICTSTCKVLNTFITIV